MVFVLPVPSQLSLEAGLEEEEAQGRAVLESARIQARRAGLKIRTGLIRTRNPGSALVEEAERVGSDVVYWSTIHAPAGEHGIGPTAAYLLSTPPLPRDHRDRQPRAGGRGRGAPRAGRRRKLERRGPGSGGAAAQPPSADRRASSSSPWRYA